MIEKWETTIDELTGDEPRTVYVYIPDAIEDNPEERYPVLYMFDGHNLFFDSDATYGKSWGMKEYMDESGTPMIIVGVDCNHTQPNGRLSEYSPFSFHDKEFGDVEGRGKIYMDWLVGTLKPEIDESYPTIPDREHTFIAGSSMGGLMSLYAISAYNHVFSRCAALSPSIWIVRKPMYRLLHSCVYAENTVVYMDYGSREMSNHLESRRALQYAVDELLNHGVFLDFRIVPNGDHCEECWEEQIPFFMQTLTYERE